MNYTVGFELNPPMGPDILKEISGLASSLSEVLPRKTEHQSFIFPPSPGTMSQSNIAGVTFDELARDGATTRQLAVSPQTISYSLAPYQRWAEYWPLANRVLATSTKVALRQSHVTGLVLNAVNRFYWDGAEDDIDYSQLIRDNCSYIAPHILKLRGLCHSFHGFVRSSDIPGRRIDNVNFTVAERFENKNAADLVFNIRVVLNNSQDFDGLFASSPNSFAADCFKHLHESNNQLFSEVIVPEICERVPGAPRL